jgi:hypothetical protein
VAQRPADWVVLCGSGEGSAANGGFGDGDVVNVLAEVELDCSDPRRPNHRNRRRSSEVA